MVERDEWNDALAGCRQAGTELAIDTVLEEHRRNGGSGAFVARGTDGQRWYFKPPNNPQGGRVVITELVVSAAGRLIGVPVCHVEPARVLPELAGHRYHPDGHTLGEGVGSASREIGSASEVRGLVDRERDDNRRRHAGVYALYDWCWGGDPQWLYVETEDRRLWSHDHGWYLPPEGPEWSESAMLASVDEPHPLPHPDKAGLDLGEITRVADALEALTRDDLISMLARVPLDWTIPDSELEALGYFLERRAPAVAKRMRELGAELLSTVTSAP